MAMLSSSDPLESVLSNVPDWLKRLQELNGQIEQRQLDLARFSESQPPSSARSIRPRGSTESLKPRDDGAAFLTADTTEDQAPLAPLVTNVPATPDAGRRYSGQAPPSTPGSDPKSGSSMLRHTDEVKASAQRRARATMRRRQKTDSMMSSEGHKPAYRNRRMVLVYYDSFVQSFFEELVKFVSAQRNLVRRAKTAAKVAHIKRLAEMEMPEDEEADDVGELQPGALMAADPTLLTLGPRPLGGRGAFRSALGAKPHPFNGRLGAFNDKGGVWDELDKGLEFVQSMCERAAHQFLRDGDCTDETEKIRDRLMEVEKLATKEKETSEKKHADTEATAQGEANLKMEASPELPQPVRSRTYRPATMRRERDTGASSPKTPAREGDLEIDDEGIQLQDDVDFKPVYRSTRLMRRPV